MSTRQDYLARIRYSNALPPLPNPPKLLDIPGTGLAGGQYTSAGYAARLAREQPLNIEADAELGMPIDLVGIPGVFVGDEKLISTRPGPPNLHPADKALLKPLSALSKPSTALNAVSFLRRTEYSSSHHNSQLLTVTTAKDVIQRSEAKPRRKPNVSKEDPINIMRNIVKGFDIAYPRDAYTGEDSTTNLRGAPITDVEVKAWANPKHPSNSELKLLDSYPVLPDLEATPTTGFYLVMKFNAAPVTMEGVKYDTRTDHAILRPVADEMARATFQQRLAEHDPNSSKPEPIPEYEYDYFLPAESDSIRGIKRKLDINDSDNEDPELYTDDLGDGQRAFKYSRLRTYETYTQSGDPHNFYDDSVAVALHDPDATHGVKNRLEKGAYFYPIAQRTSLRPKRNIHRMTMTQFDEQKIDDLNVTVVEADEGMRASQLEKRALIDPGPGSVEVAG